MILKSPGYLKFTVITFTLTMLGLLGGCLGLTVSFDSQPPNSISQAPEKSPILENHTATPKPQLQQFEPKTISDRTLESSKFGNLRISNKTYQPIRLALLLRYSPSSPSGKKGLIPAHWDFAPQEGSQGGLILSLPDGSLKLEKGDILVAFAQDGSRRYWGPYIVGETSAPLWDPKTAEWQLTLVP